MNTFARTLISEMDSIFKVYRFTTTRRDYHEKAMIRKTGNFSDQDNLSIRRQSLQSQSFLDYILIGGGCFYQINTVND